MILARFKERSGAYLAVLDKLVRPYSIPPYRVGIRLIPKGKGVFAYEVVDVMFLKQKPNKGLGGRVKAFPPEIEREVQKIIKENFDRR